MNRIKLLREEKGIFQKDLAKLLKVETPTITYYENEKRNINTTIASILADYFECSLDYLLGRSDIRNAEKELEKASNNSEIFTYYNQLNDLGKEKAIDNVKDLTKIPEYTKKRDKSQNA